MSQRVVHFENCVSIEDEVLAGAEYSQDEPFTEKIESLQIQDGIDENLNDKTERWRTLAKRVQSSVQVKNSVKPFRSRRKSIWRTPAETIDPFIQKFSTRSDNRKKTPPKRKTSYKSSPNELHANAVSNGQCAETIAEIDNKELDSDTFSSEVYLGYGSLLQEISSVFAPEGRFIYGWYYLVVFAIRYNLWVLILRISFTEAQAHFKITWLVFDYLCDFIYLVDMVISFRTGYLEEGILVNDSRKIALAYLKSKRFIADTLSIIPTEIFYVLYSIQLPLLRLNRLIKSYKSLRIKDLMESHTNYPTFHRVFFLLHLMFVLINWNASIYFMISHAEGFGTNQWVYPGNGSLYQQYLKSVYWSTLTLTAIGDLPAPETNYEFIYTIACYLCGVFMFATIVGNAGSIIVNRNASRMDFERQRESTKYYMQKNNVPKDLRRRVLMWYDYTWTRGRVGNTSGDLNSLTLLPDKLKTEIALHVNLETLSKVTFLQKCQPEFLHDLVLKMKLRIFTPGDYICRNGEVAREMFVIINGKIEVLGDSGQILKVLSGGDFFGEIGILSLSEGQNRRTADIRTIGYVECFVLSKDDVLNATRDYPEAQAVLAEYGRRRLGGQNIYKDPRLVDMEDCQPLKNQPTKPNTFSSNSSLINNSNHTTASSLTSAEALNMTSIIQPRLTSRSELLDPITTWSLPIQNENGPSKPKIQSDSSEDNAISEIMTSSVQEIVCHVKDLYRRQADLETQEVRTQLAALKQEIEKTKEQNKQMKVLLSNQESELQAWRNAVHELEEKRLEDEKDIQRLKNKILMMRCQRCTCRSDRPDGTMC